DLPGDVDVLRVPCAPAGHDRDVIEPVCPASRLADADLDFHGPSGVSASPSNSEGYRPDRLLRAFAEADRVHVVGAVAAMEVDVRVREHPLWAVPARHDPGVHHPQRVAHELPGHPVALRLRHTAVGWERDA